MPLQEEDSAAELMAAFGEAAILIQRSEYARCRSEEAGSDGVQQNGHADVDPKALAIAKQIQGELHRAMHAALSSNNGYLIIPTLPGPPLHRK